MRRGAAGLAASLGLALALCAPAAGAGKHPPVGRSVQIPTRVAGAITFTWQGDPTRGCAAAGVCDVSGSLVYTPEEAIFVGTMLPGGKLFPGEILLDSIETPMMVRVRRDPPGASPSVCVDSADAPFTALTPTPLAGGHYHVDFSDRLVFPTGVSSERCAGPVAGDLRGKLPSGVLDMAALRHGSTLLNLSARRTWSSGPYSGEMVSTLGVRVGARSSSLDEFNGFTISNGSTVRQGSRLRVVRVLELGIEYKIASLGGSLLTSFTGATGPLCAGLDACGTSGTISYSPSASTSGSLFVGASRRLHPGEHPTLGSALADLHAGRLRVDGVLDTKPGTLAHVSATVARLGDATCTDSLSPQLAPFAVFEDGHLLQLRLAKPGDESAPDGMRTRCPGPTQADTLARGSLAAGRIALARLGSRSLSARLSRPGTFDSGAYVGTRSGALDLQLARVRLCERVVRRKVAR